jgi:hypothetical protein
MQPFSTEFPVKHNDNKAAFAAEIFAWLRGINGSNVLTATSGRELDGENVYLVAESGEELRMRELKRGSEWEAIGFQHNIPDNQGRVWRTEAVLRRAGGDAGDDLIRFRTQCFAKEPGAFLASPKKPYLVKSLLKSAWGGLDGDVEVCDTPLWLKNEDDDLAFAKRIIEENASRWLPVVYISSIDHDSWLLSPDQITKLAYDLGGIAHVVVEPNRGFSIRLRDESGGGNIYNGTVGIAMPQRGFVRRFFLARLTENVSDLIDATRSAATLIRGFMPSLGMDWTDLQEKALINQRAAMRGALSQEDADQLFDDFTKQLSDLQEENRRLIELSNSKAVNDIVEEEKNPQRASDFKSTGPEVYEGEITDRIRFAAKIALSVAEPNGIDARSIAIWTRILDRVPRSPALDELLADLGRATKDPKRIAGEVSDLLERHGYRSKSDNRHIRLEPKDEYYGLANITVPKTPGEIRGLKNLQKQIERTLGISKLPGNTEQR